MKQHLFPDAILDLDIKELKATNAKLDEKIAECKEKMPGKKEAYTYALELEQASLESFFNRRFQTKQTRKQ